MHALVVYSKNAAQKIQRIIEYVEESQDIFAVIIDDHSADDTKKILSKRNHKKIDSIALEVDSGFDVAVLQGIYHVIRGMKTSTITILDGRDDDVFYARQLIKQLDPRLHILYFFHTDFSFFEWLYQVYWYVRCGEYMRSIFSHYMIVRTDVIKSVIADISPYQADVSLQIKTKVLQHYPSSVKGVYK